MTYQKLNDQLSMKIVNLTQHNPTRDQTLSGVYNPKFWDEIKEYLVFECIPTKAELKERAYSIVVLLENESADAAMIGGAPYLMAHLEHELKIYNIKPLYAFSKQASVFGNVDGKIVEHSVSRHVGFVEA